MTVTTTGGPVLGGPAAGAIAATIIPFPSRQAEEQAQLQRRVLSILRRLPPQYRRPWVRMGERMVNGMPTDVAGKLFYTECEIADTDAGFGITGVAS